MYLCTPPLPPFNTISGVVTRESAREKHLCQRNQIWFVYQKAGNETTSDSTRVHSAVGRRMNALEHHPPSHLQPAVLLSTPPPPLRTPPYRFTPTTTTKVDVAKLTPSTLTSPTRVSPVPPRSNPSGLIQVTRTASQTETPPSVIRPWKRAGNETSSPTLTYITTRTFALAGRMTAHTLANTYAQTGADTVYVHDEKSFEMVKRGGGSGERSRARHDTYSSVLYIDHRSAKESNTYDCDDVVLI